MDKKGYYIIGIFIIAVLSIIYVSQIDREINEKKENGTNPSYRTGTESYIDRGNQTCIKIRGKLFSEEPILKNSRYSWSLKVVFDSNITEKEAKDIISGYEIPRTYSIERGGDPEYYISIPMSDFESIKNRLEGDECTNIQLANKIKITGENFTAAVWGVNNKILPGLRSSGLKLKETMVMVLIYGPETPQTESKNIMEQLDRDENIIETTVSYFY